MTSVVWRRASAAALAASLLAPGVRADALTVYFSEEETTVGVGDEFTLEIRADNLADIIGWGIDFAMDAPDVIELLGIEVDAPWIQANGLDDDELCGVADFASSPINGSNIVIATLSFEATALGDVQLSLSETDGDLTEGWPTLGEPGSFTTATYVDAVVHVVPEPAGGALLGLGLMMLRRRS